MCHDPHLFSPQNTYILFETKINLVFKVTPEQWKEVPDFKLHTCAWYDKVDGFKKYKRPTRMDDNWASGTILPILATEFEKKCCRNPTCREVEQAGSRVNALFGTFPHMPLWYSSNTSPLSTNTHPVDEAQDHDNPKLYSCKNRGFLPKHSALHDSAPLDDPLKFEAACCGCALSQPTCEACNTCLLGSDANIFCPNAPGETCSQSLSPCLNQVSKKSKLSCQLCGQPGGGHKCATFGLEDRLTAYERYAPLEISAFKTTCCSDGDTLKKQTFEGCLDEIVERDCSSVASGTL